MPIERDPSIEFHPSGTLQAVTRWISSHEGGIAEWAKNARRAYQADRADVLEEHRAAAILLRDGEGGTPGRIAFLDVGGATLDDLTAWSVWQDPQASTRNSDVEEEVTQGNGGKAYMYRLFRGQTRILGVVDGKRNCKGFEGEPGTVNRGTPGFIPDMEGGRDAAAEMEEELNDALQPYGLSYSLLPDDLQRGVAFRKAFTLVEGEDPVGVHRGRLDAEQIIQRFLRHDQASIVLEQMRVYAAHNSSWLNDCKSLRRDPIPTYPGVEGPYVFEIPDRLPDEEGMYRSTTEDGGLPIGKVTIRTSNENMPAAWSRLRPRWKVVYRTRKQVIGSKSVSDVVPSTPGYKFVYALVELDALDSYATHGRLRPREGPLVSAVEGFVAEKVTEIARDISEKSRQEMNEQALDDVHQENQKLDAWKNRFLDPSGADGGGGGDNGGGGRKLGKGHKIQWGEVVELIELDRHEEPTRIGKGVKVNLSLILKPVPRDYFGKPVRGLELEWLSSDRRILEFPDSSNGQAVALQAGTTKVRVRLADASVVSEAATVEVWVVDHVLLTPRQLEMPVGTRKQITAEVTSEAGERSVKCLLNWRHDADDQMIVRIRPTGWITGNRAGQTVVYAGAGDHGNGVWARIGVNAQVLPNPEAPEPGEGFPHLLITDRDFDPDTGETRQGDPESPALWQEPIDVKYNVWWLNLQAPDAHFAFAQRGENPQIWRQFHAWALTQMVKQVHMHDRYTRSQDDEPPQPWATHKLALDDFEVNIARSMWDPLRRYVLTGEGIE